MSADTAQFPPAAPVQHGPIDEVSVSSGARVGDFPPGRPASAWSVPEGEAKLGTLICPEPDERPDLWPSTCRRVDGKLWLGGVNLAELVDADSAPDMTRASDTAGAADGAGQASTTTDAVGNTPGASVTSSDTTLPDSPEPTIPVTTPVFVLDQADVVGRATVWASAMAEEFWDGYNMAGGDAFYAGKAFLSSHMARLVTQAGLGVDTASLGELELVLRAGADPHRVGLHGNNKSRQQLIRAISAGEDGIARIFIDSPHDVDRIADAARQVGRTARVMIRLKTGIHAGGNEYVATSHEDQKFGVSLSDGQAMDVVKQVLARPELELQGFHNHIGSQIFGVAAFEEAARRVLEFRQQVARECGVLVADIDLGGGLGIAYSGADEPAPGPAVIARAVADVVRETCAAQGLAVPHVSVEPGRSVVGASMITLYRVGDVKDVQLPGGVRRYVAVDGGMSDNIRPALYQAKYTATVANRTPVGPWARCRVVGKHCESGDVVVWDVDLPADLAEGDLLAVPATGAYGYSMASNYNMATKPGVLAVADGNAHWWIRPETLDDLLHLDTGL